MKLARLTGSSPARSKGATTRRLRHTDRSDPLFGSSRDRVLAAGRPLLIAAQHAGEVRTDLTVDQVLDLVLAAATVPGGPACVQPNLRAALDGLRPRVR